MSAPLPSLRGGAVGASPLSSSSSLSALQGIYQGMSETSVCLCEIQFRWTNGFERKAVVMCTSGTRTFFLRKSD